jgi:hypothetical protein
MGKLEAHKDPPCHDLSIFPCESFPTQWGNDYANSEGSRINHP